MRREAMIRAIKRGPIPKGDHVREHESPIERDLAYQLNKFREKGPGKDIDGTPIDSDKEVAYLAAQVPLPTSISDKFRGDLGMVHANVTVLFEADGREFHKDKVYEDLRTAAIFKDSLIDHVFRFSGTMLYHSPEDALYLTKQVLPQLFHSSANYPLHTLSTVETKEVAGRIYQGCGPVYLEYEATVEKREDDDDGNAVLGPSPFSFAYIPRAEPTPRIRAYMDVIEKYKPTSIQSAREIIKRVLGH